jgi:outer membrane protein W
MLLCGSVGLAGDAVDFGFRGGYQRFADEGNGAFMGGLFLRVNWRSVIFTEGAVLYHSEDVGSSDVELIPIQLSAMLFFLRRDLDLSPYLLAGVGAYLTRSVEEDGSDSDTQFDLGWHLGLGLDYALSDRVFVEGDLRYIWLDVDFEGETVSDKLTNYNNWLAAVGLGFRL